MTTTLSDAQFKQYYRHILLPEVGEHGQLLLKQQHVLIIGMGGLGTHVAQQLTAAGIGALYLLDDDYVDISNLPRQVLFDKSAIGKSKVETAVTRLRTSNDDCHIRSYQHVFSVAFINQLLLTDQGLKEAYLSNKLWVLDCTDNMSSRQLINLWCVRHMIPLISAAVSGFSGQLMVVDVKRAPEAGCLHCLYPTQTVSQNCNDAGVLGPTVGLIASMQALTTLKLILNIGLSTENLYVFNAINLEWRQVLRQQDLNCSVCCTNS